MNRPYFRYHLFDHICADTVCVYDKLKPNKRSSVHQPVRAAIYLAADALPVVWQTAGEINSVKMNDSTLNRHRDGLGAVGDAQFAQNIFQMPFDRVFADSQGIGNLFISQPFDHFVEN